VLFIATWGNADPPDLGSGAVQKASRCKSGCGDWFVKEEPVSEYWEIQRDVLHAACGNRLDVYHSNAMRNMRLARTVQEMEYWRQRAAVAEQEMEHRRRRGS